jgi:hypothetical protein
MTARHDHGVPVPRCRWNGRLLTISRTSAENR